MESNGFELIGNMFDKDEFKGLLHRFIKQDMNLALQLIPQLALRMGARVMPLIAAEGNLNFWKHQKADNRVRNLSGVLGIIHLSHLPIIHLGDASDAFARANVAFYGTRYAVASSVENVCQAIERAARTVNVALATDTTDKDRAFNAADAAASTVAIALSLNTGAPYSNFIFDALRNDFSRLQDGVSSFQNSKLWDTPPNWFVQGLNQLEDIVVKLPRVKSEQAEEWDVIELGLNLLWQEAGMQRSINLKPDTYQEKTVFSFLSTNQTHPEIPSTTDKLNRQKLVNALAINLIHSTNNHHRAIGLLGEWGSGKSTVLALLKQQLKEFRTEQPFIFGEFNAWAYEHTDNIQAGVAQEMINALTSAPAKSIAGIKSFWYSVVWLFQRAWLTLKFSVKTHPFEILKILALLLVAVMPWFSDWFQELINDEELASVGRWVWSGGLVLYTLREFGKLIISPQAKELLTYLRLPSYAEHLGTIPVMRKHIGTLCELCLKAKHGKTPRLLFVVDDLDRCSPEAIVKVLEAVRLVLDLKNVIVLIAIDQHIALAALSKHFNDFALHHKLKNSHAIAREYLSKVINLPIVLTAPGGDEVNIFMTDLWKDMPKASRVEAGNAGPKAPPDTAGPRTSGKDDPVIDPRAKQTLESTEQEKPKTFKDDDLSSGGINSIKALSLEQQASFVHWVNYFGLTNPRQLKRLNNSYDLMRSYFPGWDKTPVAFNLSNENAQSVYPMLLTLILMEYLNNLEDLDMRVRLWKKLFSTESDQGGFTKGNITQVDPEIFDKVPIEPAFIRSYRQLLQLQDYKYLEANVKAFVLPAMV